MFGKYTNSILNLKTGDFMVHKAEEGSQKKLTPIEGFNAISKEIKKWFGANEPPKKRFSYFSLSSKENSAASFGRCKKECEEICETLFLAVADASKSIYEQSTTSSEQESFSKNKLMKQGSKDGHFDNTTNFQLYAAYEGLKKALTSLKEKMKNPTFDTIITSIEIAQAEVGSKINLIKDKKSGPQ
jgi:hypothetical protein